MKTKEIIKITRGLAKLFRVSKGKDFRLKDVVPNNTQALANGVTAEVHGQQ